MKRIYLIYIVSVIGLISGVECRQTSSPPSNTTSNQYIELSNKMFVDSTYIHEKNSYKMREKVYVIVFEPTMVAGWPDTVQMPDIVKISVVSSLGDTEMVSATGGIIPTALRTKAYGGWIKTKGTPSFSEKNGILEVNPSGGSIFAFYSHIISKVVGLDTAKVLP
ncbi:MAG TPA: hypothetical protein ENH23_02935 [candidate division Zixibacteria bacterium]|nr:hypothetical protein [candidate division Zixibacteria bacterium]